MNGVDVSANVETDGPIPGVNSGLLSQHPGQFGCGT
jgi:hypothetical protein